MKARVAVRMVAILLVVMSIGGLRSQSQTAVSWNGGNGGWNTGTDWSGGVVPNNGGGKTYNVTISNGTAETVTLDLGVTISDLTLGTSATLQSSASNSLTIASGGTFTNSGTLNFNTGANVLTVQSGGSLINNGAMTFSGTGSGLNVTGTTTNNSGHDLFIEGGSTGTFTGNVNNSGVFETGFSGGSNTVTVSGAFTNNSGGQFLVNAANDLVTVSGTLTNNNGATLQVNGTGGVLNVNALSNAGSLTVASGATLTITGGGNGVTDAVAGSTYNINGSFNVKNGSTTTSAVAKLTSVEGSVTIGNGQPLTITPTGGTLTISSLGSFGVDGTTTVSLSGAVNNSGIFETGFSGGNNLVTVTGAFTNNAGAQLNVNSTGDVLNVSSLTNAGTLNIVSGTTLNITGGGNGITDVVSGSTYNITGNFNVKNGSTTTSALAKLTSVEGTLNLSNLQANTMTPIGGTFTNTGTFNVEGGTTLTLTGNVSNSGTFETGFSGSNNAVTVSGTFTNNAGGRLIVNGSGDTMNVNALSNSGTLTIASGATLTITGGGNGVTDVVKGSDLTVDGTFNVKNGGTTTSALAKLTSVEGTLNLNNGLTNTVTPTGGTLTIASGGSLGVSDGAATTTTLSITGNVNNSGTFSTGFSGGTNTVNVSGTFTNAAGAQTIVYGNADNVNVNALSNSGVLQIGNSPGSTATLTITGGGQGITDAVAGSTLTLYGNLNVKNGGTTTSGLAHLTSVEGVLNLQNAQSNTVTPNGGTLTISSTGALVVNDVTTLAVTGNVSNSGTFTEGFLGASNTVNVSGTFTNATGAVLNVEGSGDVMNIATLTNSGTVNVIPSTANTVSTLVITGSGTLTNSGSINVTSGTLKFNSSSASLTGGGTVTLGVSAGSTIPGLIQVGASDTGTLTNVNNTITGFGNLGNGTLTLVNQGTINANGQANTGRLTVQPGSGGMTNTGTMEATNQGTLVLTGTFNNTGGTIEALGETGGTVTPTVQLTAGTVINGGTLTTTTVGSNSGLIEGTGAVTLNGVTNSGTYAVNAGTTTTLEGTITNSGSITLSGSTLSLGNSVTLNGKGTVVLSNSASNLITGATSGLTLTTANTIEGAGTISNLGIVNTGTIAANQSTPLIILPSSAGLNNKGTLSVSTGDTMQIGTSAGGALLNFAGTTLTGGTYTVSGTLQFGASGTSLVTDAASISLTGSGAKIIDFGGHSVLTNLATITSAGSLTLSSGANFTTAGNFTNNGKLTANSGTTFKVTGTLTNFNSSNNTLTGGTYTVGGKLNFAGANIVTDAANITMNGTGEIVNSTNSSNGLTNLATITSAGSFTLASHANFTTLGNLTDNGRLTVNSGSTLTIAGTLTNFNSSTNTLASGTYTVGGTMEFTGANIVNNAANLTITGTSAKILNGTTNGLANFANNTGAFTVTGNGSFTTAPSNFTNSGTVTVAKGSTMTVGGNNAYNQSAGTTTVDGTLTGSAGINVTGGSILGAGRLGGNVTVGGSGTAPTISAGDTGKAGLLAITSNYTQLSTATMNSFIGGTTVGTQYSQLQVGGTASLAGALTVTLASGFTPTIGSTFTVLTAATVTGTFSNSTIAINGTEHFNVSYTTTGVVLTVASGVAPQSGGLPRSALAVALSRKQQPVLTSGLRHGISGTPRGGSHIFVAGLGNSRARSGAILAGGYGLNRYEGSNRVPLQAAALWERKPPVAAPVAELQLSRERVSQSLRQSNLWNGAARGGSSLRMPVAGTLMRRTPVRVMPPMLPRMGR
jgi:fibronectin-binding autotransporter adhesin